MKKTSEIEIRKTKETQVDTLRGHIKFLEAFLETIPIRYSSARHDITQNIYQYKMTIVFLEASKKAFESARELDEPEDL
jgi:hypothetical protein